MATAWLHDLWEASTDCCTGDVQVACLHCRIESFVLHRRETALAEVHSMLHRGRLVSRVHIAAVPMWTLRSRTILLRLSSALRAEPMDERLVLHLWAQ